MKLCRVMGPVVSTVKHPTYVGRTLLVVQPVDDRGKPVGTSFLAVDTVQAGEGDLVLVNQEGGGARMVMGIEQLPMRSLIVGVVDRVDVV
jgi:microcompartment protein CcmK/EutM